MRKWLKNRKQLPVETVAIGLPTLSSGNSKVFSFGKLQFDLNHDKGGLINNLRYLRHVEVFQEQFLSPLD